MASIGTFSKLHMDDGWSFEVIDGNLSILHNDIVHHTWTHKRKVLCLHGGGGSSTSMRAQMSSLMNDEQLSNYTFVFASAPEDGNLWIRDPPNGKENPTTSEDWAQSSVDYLNSLIGSDTYYALIGYSQGGAMAAVYLSTINVSKFQKVLFFSGYLPTTHSGLMNRINNGSQYPIPALVYRGVDDFISSSMINALASKFVDPLVIDSDSGGHYVPTADESDYTTVVDFLLSRHET